jgi:predicted RNA binding protein YcfA (HicA-like mRNA interferase family)
VKAISGKRFARILEGRGWELLRVVGSHHVYGKAGVRERISLPIHGNQPLKLGLQAHFMKVAGISESDLESGQRSRRG